LTEPCGNTLPTIHVRWTNFTVTGTQSNV
jgi:hypothetical protein